MQLLASLGYDLEQDGAAAPNRIALLRLAARLDRVFRITSPFAPGLASFGAQLRGEGWQLNASGAGAHLDDAFAGCVGEAAEFLSQLERPGDVACTAPIGAVADRADPAECEELAIRPHEAGLPADTALDWTPGAELGIPCVAAISCGADGFGLTCGADGFGLTCGVAARPGLAWPKRRRPPCANCARWNSPASSSPRGCAPRARAP